ncbi:MAG: O-antigen ligase family protein [Actinomycetota bacterium]|nr:O-antigen ligase family protein [Actinomycetota bacterium]
MSVGLPTRPRRPQASLWGAGALILAAGAGVATGANPVLGAAATIGGLALATAVLRPHLICYLLVIAIFTSPLTVGGVTIGRLTAPLALVAVATQLFSNPIRFPAKVLLAIVAGYALFAAVSVGWTVHMSGTIDELTSLLASLAQMAAFAFLMREPKDFRKLLGVVTVSSVALALLWTLGYATGADRRYNVTGDPNYFASLQVLALPMVLVFASHARDVAARLVISIAVAIIAGSVVATLSRGGILTLLGTAAVILFLPARTLFRSREHKVALFACAAVGLSALLAVAWTDISRRFSFAYEQEISGGRGDLWAAGLTGYREHPLTGIGFGAFKPVSFKLLSSTPGVDLEGHLRFAEGEYIHNAYIGSLVDLGPLGFALFLGVFVGTGYYLLRSSKRARLMGDVFLSRLSIALAVALLSFAVSSLSLSTETSRALWMIVGLTVALTGMVDRRWGAQSAIRA